MARPLRVESPGAFYHVINRGNAGEDIFKSIRDREKYLEYLEAASSRFSLRIHTFCLMTNHYHLLVETPEANLSQAIQWINVSYAVYFNIKRQRRGHLFQGRFKSLLVDADEYLKHLSRYIHLNPVRAKMVESASQYPWSSYPFFIGKLKIPEWLAGDWLLSQFGKNLREARKNYQAFVEGPDPWTLEDPGKSPVGGFILSRKLTRLSGKELGRYFGNVSGAAIAMRHKAVNEQLKKDRKLQSRIKRLERRILNN